MRITYDQIYASYFSLGLIVLKDFQKLPDVQNFLVFPDLFQRSLVLTNFPSLQFYSRPRNTLAVAGSL